MWSWIDAHLTAANLWQLFAFSAVVTAAVWAYRVQVKPENGVNFLELVQDPDTKKLDPERFAYVGTWLITSVAVIFGVTRPGATLEGIATIIVTYGGLWVTGKALRKFADRPQVVAPATPAPLATTVNVNPPPGGTS